MPSQPARDKGCGTQRLDTHNAACGIETNGDEKLEEFFNVSTHTMLRAALKPRVKVMCIGSECCLDTHNAACGIETDHGTWANQEAMLSRHTQCCVRH